MSRKKKRQYAGKGFIHKRVWGSTKLRNFFKTELKRTDLHDKGNNTLRFLIHVYASMQSQIRLKDKDKKKGYLQKKGFIPIFSRLIDKELGREFNVISLRDAGLIEMTPHRTAQHKSREYRLTSKIWDKALKIETDTIKKHWHSLVTGNPQKYRPVNLIDGTLKRTIHFHRLKREDTPNTPKLIKDSIFCLKYCPLDPRYIEIWIKDLEETLMIQENKLKGLKKSKKKNLKAFQQLEADTISLRGKYLNERLSQRVILEQQPQLLRQMKRRTKNGLSRLLGLGH